MKESLDTKLEVLTGQLHEANTRIDQIENVITKNAKEIDDTYERLLSLERYSRDYNLRFYNIPESTGEDCIAKLRDIIENDLQLQSNIENAHRIGPFKDDGTTRPNMGPLLTVTDVLSTPGKFGSTKIQCPKGNAKAECPNLDSDSEEVWST